MSADIPQLDWQDWMRRYEQQQSTYLPDRENHFTIMLDVLETLLPQHFVALDLVCCPGSLSQRLLSCFPQARCVSVDIDPILLLPGQQVLGDMQGRLRWVEADISEPCWHSQPGEEQVDAVVTTTALHWLHVGSLVELYRQLGVLVRPGGVFLNGMASGLPRISQASTWLQNTGMSSGQPWPVQRGRKIGRSGGTSFGESQGWSRSWRNVRVVSAPKRAPLAPC